MKNVEDSVKTIETLAKAVRKQQQEINLLADGLEALIKAVENLGERVARLENRHEN